jgi:hypothetical protein
LQVLSESGRGLPPRIKNLADLLNALEGS